ncbi:MAG: winged helix-turn-helix transcriptional regulator, partial [Promethearchaeota archaeon]
MSNIKRKYKNKFFYLTINFYLLVFSLIFVLIIYLLNEFLKRDLAFGKRIFDSTLVFFIIFLIILIIPILTILTLNEYKNYIRKQSQVSNETRDHTLDDIFENEVREKIIKIILENPGIHTNEILRDLDLAKGQLQWHLDILLSNGIIKMKKLGQYKTFYSKLNNK